MAASEAVKTKAEIEVVEALLRKFRRSPLYGDIWRIGVNMALRISDMLLMRYDHIDLVKREYKTVEKKTGKKRTIRLNNTAIALIEKRRQAYPYDVYVFQSDYNRKRHIAKPVARTEVCKAFREVGDVVKVQLGTHSMRKSRGWAMYTDGVPIEMIAKVLNHSSPAATMLYLGITEEEVMQTYDDYEL